LARVVAVLVAVVLGLMPRLGAAASCIIPPPGPETGRVRHVDDLPGDGLLIVAAEGLFRFDPATGAIVPAPGPDKVAAVYDLPGGGLLIVADEGWFRFDPATGAIVAVPGPKTGQVFNYYDLPGGGALIIAAEGWFHFDPATGAIVAVPRPKTGQVFNYYDLSGPGLLIVVGEVLARFEHEQGRTGVSWRWFRFDPAAGAIVPVPGPKTGQVADVHPSARRRLVDRSR
jgi:hypothetical protein